MDEATGKFLIDAGLEAYIETFKGKPSALFDETHPDWAPTLHLWYERKKGRQTPLETSMNRYIRTQERRRKKIMFPTVPENRIVLNDDKDNYAAPDQQVQL